MVGYFYVTCRLRYLVCINIFKCFYLIMIHALSFICEVHELYLRYALSYAFERLSFTQLGNMLGFFGINNSPVFRDRFVMNLFGTHVVMILVHFMSS